jgi:hypothetical protein
VLGNRTTYRKVEKTSKKDSILDKKKIPILKSFPDEV